MTSDLSEKIDLLKLEEDESVSASSTTTTRRYYRTGHHQRHHLHSKRAATLDPETNEEKLRIVILGATKVGKSIISLSISFISIVIQVKHVYVNNFFKKNSFRIIKKLSMKCIVSNFHLSIVE